MGAVDCSFLLPLTTFIQAAVVEKVDNCIKSFTHWIAQLVSAILICWIVFYPLDGAAIQLLNNWPDQVY